MRVTERFSPHSNERPEGTTIDLVVLHFISLPTGVFSGDAVERLFAGTLDTDEPVFADLKGLRVSSHFFIRRTGEILSFVPVERRAWHAGVSVFHGRSDCNNRSVGIELEGTGELPFEDAQYEALAALLADLSAHLPIRWVTGHEHVAPGRKSDPGPFFDWRRLARALPRLRFDLRPQTGAK